MYTEFTAQEQKPLHMNSVRLDARQLPRLGRRKKQVVHSKNPYKIKKVPVITEERMKKKVLDGFMLLKMFNRDSGTS
jgi:hypothetical protein